MKQSVVVFKSVFFLVFIFCSIKVFSQVTKHRIEQVVELQKSEPRNLIVFLHTDWCNYCEGMLNSTFKNEDVKVELKYNFYFTELNAEEKQEINFAGAIFKYRPTGVKTGFHELATSLGTIEGDVAFPTLVILNPENEIIFQYKGFMSAKDLMVVLKEIKLGKS